MPPKPKPTRCRCAVRLYALVVFVGIRESIEDF